MDPQKMIGTLLECSVCLEPLGSNHKVLPCQHTFCLPCLKDVWAGHRAKAASRNAGSGSGSEGWPLCPECRSECRVGDPKDLPSNVILNRLLDGMQGMSLNPSNNNGDEQPQRPQDQGKENTIPINLLPNNPFLSMLTPSPSSTSLDSSPSGASVIPSTSPTSPVPVLPPKPGGNSSSFFGVPPSVPLRPARTTFPVTPPVTSVAATTANTRPPSTAIHNTNFLGAASTGIPASSSNCAKAGPSTSQIANLNQKQAGHQIYRAIYNYNPVKADELTLKKNELYIVIEKCQDGWFKGSSVNSLKTGVFPGNYVQHIQKESQVTTSNVTAGAAAAAAAITTTNPNTFNSSASGGSVVLSPTRVSNSQAPVCKGGGASVGSGGGGGSNTPDLIDLTTDEFLSDLFSTTKTIVPPNVTTSWSFPKRENANFQVVKDRVTAAVAASSSGSPAARAAPPPPPPSPAHRPPPVPQAARPTPAPVRYRCVMAYPASSQYELDLSEGEVILLLKRREDGWCKGTVEGTNRTGLFPANFVQKL